MECCRVVDRDVRRGLCRTCYRNVGIRKRYPTLARGCHHDTSRVWDEIDITRLKRFYHRGYSDKYIAEKLGRSVGSVCKQRQRLGLVVSHERQNYHRRLAWTEEGEVKDGHSEHTSGSG